jgi:hypothetical protein
VSSPIAIIARLGNTRPLYYTFVVVHCKLIDVIFMVFWINGCEAVLKNVGIFFACTTPHSMCSHRVSWKTDIFFMGNAKMLKKSCCEKAYSSTELCDFYIGHIKNHFFTKLLSEHVEYEDIHIHFSLIFLILFKYVKNAFQIKEAYNREKKRAMSSVFCLLFTVPISSGHASSRH